MTNVQTTIGKYQISDGRDTGSRQDHNHADYACVLHCDCNDHYYRCRDCKHLESAYDAYDAFRGWFGVS